MKNLMKQIAMSLSLTMMVASLVAISPNQAQAKGKKKAGNAKGFSVDIGTSEKIKSQPKRTLNTQSGDDVVTINSLTGTAVKRVRRTTKRTRQ